MSRPDIDDPVSRLLKLAGEPDQPSAEGTARAREAAEAAWQRALAPAARTSKAPRRWMLLAAAVACLALGLVALWPAAAPPAPVARVANVQGEVAWNHGNDVAHTGVVFAGATLATGEGRGALIVGDALSLRVDRQSRLRFDAPDRITLLEGRVYVDTGGVNAPTALRVATPAGELKHLGTQYQVRVTGSATQVRVREGRVSLDAGAAPAIEAAAGDLLVADGRRIVVTGGQPAHGQEWEWATLAAPPFDMEGRPMTEFLAWMAREHGWRLQFADDALQARVQQIRLHGSLRGLDAYGMLERVAMITGVPLAARDGVLWVGAEPRR